MLYKNLKIWLGISTISILILLFWTNRPMEIIPFLIKNDAYLNQKMSGISEGIMDAIYKQVEAYPQYQEYYDKSKTVDSMTQNSLKHVVKTDLNEQRNYVADSLFKPFIKNRYDEEDLNQILAHIYDYSNDGLAQKKLQNWSLNLTKSTMFQRNRIALLNYFAIQTSGSWHYYDSAEPILISQSINTLVNEKRQFQIGLSQNNTRLKNLTYWINDDILKTKNRSVSYKKQTSKSGWNDLKIKYQGEYENHILTDSLTYRYYVCD